MTKTTPINNRRDRLTTHRNSVAELILDQIVAGTSPWQQPWSATAVAALVPHNPATGRAYSGANSLFAQLIMASLGSADPRFLTYRQAVSKGWQVRKGTHGHSFILYKSFRRKTEDGTPAVDEKGNPIVGRYLSTFTVFHASQIDGIPAWELDCAPEWSADADADATIAATGAKITTGRYAAYFPDADVIQLPPRSAFTDRDDYYATLLHELAHWTGGAARLNRPTSGGFGSDSYAREELVADMGALLMAQRLGVGFCPGQTAAYVESWAQRARGELVDLVSDAVVEASRAVDLVCGSVGVREVPVAA